MRLSIEPEQDDELPRDPVSMAEKDLFIINDAFDANEVEDHSLNAQIEGSLRKPAYLQSGPDKETSEETSEED